MLKMKKYFIFVLTIILSISLFGCGKINNDGRYDKITKTLKLTKEFVGKDFLTDGIGIATVDAYTDGDTARFRLASGQIISLRFYEIDTPESTSTIEKWGKAASNFTKFQLQKATEIVLEATGPKAVHDSYGTRYLGYVWYKTEDNDFKNLNLELVENGFTEDKGIDTKDFPYYSYFRKATEFAQAHQLHVFSYEEDPLYTNDPVLMTIKEFDFNHDLYYSEETESGAKVMVYGVLTNLRVADSGTYTYTLTEIDPETLEVHSIDLYAGYVSSTATKLKVGYYYEVVGRLGKYNGRFQIADILYDPIFNAPGYTIEKIQDYYLTFNSQLNFRNQYSKTLYTDLEVTSVEVVDGKIKVTGLAAKINSAEDISQQEDQFTVIIPTYSGYSNNIRVGQTLSFSGYQFVKDSKEIVVLSYSDVIFR